MGTINEKLEYLDNTKQAIKEAIINKGVSIDEQDTFRSYAEKIQSIEVGGDIMSEPLTITPDKQDPNIVETEQYSLYDAPFTDSTSTEYEGVSHIKVRKIGSWIDSEISADNIREGHTILGVAGNVIQLNSQPNVTVKPSTIQKIISPEGDYNSLSQVTVEPIVLQSKDIKPSSSSVSVTPDSGYDGLNKVTVSAVTADVDPDIKEENIKKGINILGVTGTYEAPQPVLSTLTIEPKTSSQQFLPEEGIDGFSQVDVNAVTSAIDTNIKPTNIKRGVEILGVTGTYIPENLQDKVVTPSTMQQIVTYDDTYDGLNSVTVNAVTSAIDSDIQEGNIKKGIEILGVTGTYEGETYNLEESKTVDPQITPLTVTPSEGFDALKKVNVNAVTASIDANIKPENIKQNVQILGIEGTYEGKDYNFQESKTVTPKISKQEVVADSAYDALLKVIIEAVTASIDPNIKPENIRKNIQILGVVGNLIEGEPQKWFDFSNIKSLTQLGLTTLGGGNFDDINKIIMSNPYILKQIINDNFNSISNISAVLFNTIIGYDNVESTNPLLYQPFIYFNNGGFYDENYNYTSISGQICYIYDFVNDFNVNGCLLNYTDTGDEKQYNIYVLIDSLNIKQPVPVLVDGYMSGGLLPEGYDKYRFVNEITIPRHNLFIPKLDNNLQLHWILSNMDNVIGVTTLYEDKPLNIDISASDLNYGESDEYTNYTQYIENFKTIGALTKSNHIISGFSASDYIRGNIRGTLSDLEITCKCHVVGYHSKNILFNSENKGFGIDGSSSYRYWRIYNGSDNNSARYGYTNDTTYWIKLIQTSSSTKLLTIEDDGTYLNISQLPESANEAWKTQVTINSALFNNLNEFNIGNGYNILSEFWSGNIDFNNFEIKIGEDIWVPYSSEIYKITTHDIIPMQKDLIFFNDYELKALNTGFEKIGDINVSEEGIASGASANNYLKIPTLPSSAKSVIMIFNATTNNVSTSQQIASSENPNVFITYVQYTGYFKAYHTSAVGGITKITANDNYWYAIYFDGYYWSGYSLLDDGTYQLNNLPKFEKWTRQWILEDGNYTFLGYPIRLMASDTQPWLGTFDLNKCAIYIDDVLWWTPFEKETQSYKGNLYNYTDTGITSNLNVYAISLNNNNYIKIGNVNIDEQNNASFVDQYSMIQSSYITLSNNFELYLKITMPETLAGGETVFAIGNENNETSNNMLYIALNNNGNGLYVKVGTVFDTSSELITVEANQTYYIKLEYVDNVCTLYSSTSGFQEMQSVKSVNNVIWSISNKPICIGNQLNYTSKTNFTGKIDLKETYIKVNGVDFWRCIDEKRNYILSPDENFEIENATKLGLVGNIEIPEHQVFENVEGKWVLKQ